MTSTPLSLHQWWFQLGLKLSSDIDLFRDGLLAQPGPVDLTQPGVDDYDTKQPHLWDAWLRRAHRQESDWVTLDTMLPLLLDPPSHVTVPPRQWVSVPQKRGRDASPRSPLHQRLDAAMTTESHHNEGLLTWLGAASHADLMAWRPDNGRDQVAASPRSTPILTLALARHLPEEFLRDLLAHGARWDVPTNGVMPAQEIRTAAQWSLFLETGGNPDLMLPGRGDPPGPDVPLWRWLQENYRLKDASWLVAWSSQHRSSGQEPRWSRITGPS